MKTSSSIIWDRFWVLARSTRPLFLSKVLKKPKFSPKSLKTGTSRMSSLCTPEPMILPIKSSDKTPMKTLGTATSGTWWLRTSWAEASTSTRWTTLSTSTCLKIKTPTCTGLEELEDRKQTEWLSVLWWKETKSSKNNQRQTKKYCFINKVLSLI